MIVLRAIEQREFSNYEKEFISDYSEDLRINHKHSEEESEVIAKNALSNSFPRGISESNDILQCIEFSGEIVGYLWHSLSPDQSKAFISDIFVLETFRSKGYGKMAISELEKQLSREKISTLSLRVAHDNPRALELYKRVGFHITGTNMSKKLP